MVIKQDNTISGVHITPLKIIEDDRGAVLHMMRADSVGYLGFGEVYFSSVKPGMIKGWKRHKKMTQNFVVPYGLIKLIIVDKRQSSTTQGVVQSIILGRPSHYHRVTIPPLLWYAFQALSHHDVILANCANMPHDVRESECCDLNALGVDYESF